jgi:hypothetical protein
MRRIASSVLVTTVCACSPVAAQRPQLTGALSIDIATGNLSADVCLGPLGATPPYSFALHHGLNIESIRSSTGRRLSYEGHAPIVPAGVALRYTVRDTLGPARTLCVRYSGVFPVYDTTAAILDGKETIAFGHHAVRAAEDTRWYPVPYDSASDSEHAEMFFRLHVICPDCTTIYINGSTPTPGPVADLSSSRSRPLLLYAGNFPAAIRHGRRFIGAEISDTAAGLLETKLGGVLHFYEDLLRLPQQDTVVFMSFQPTRSMRLGQLWAFVTPPTIAVNKDFAVFVSPEYGDAMMTGTLTVLAHEIAHFYLGDTFSPQGPYTQFYMESVAEYLGFKAVERLSGEVAMRTRLKSRYEELRDGPPLPALDRIDEIAAQGRNPLDQNRYRYSYGPLLLLALEREIGMPAMARVLRSFLQMSPPQALGYGDLRKAVIAAGVPLDTWQRFERECVHADTDAPCFRTLLR